jgi:hypothetical protein
MKSRLMVIGFILALGTGVAVARTLVEDRLGAFSISLDRDTRGGTLQLIVRAATQSNTGESIREVDNIKIPPTQIEPVARTACRTCYDAVFNAYSLSETIPTPKVMVTP